MWIIINDDNIIQGIENRPFELKDLVHKSLYKYYREIDQEIDYEEGDKYIAGEIIKPSYFYAHEINSEHVLEFIKSFEEINKELYYNIGSRENYDLYVNSGKTYVEKNGEIEEYLPPVTKEEKFAQLETFINNLKEEGVIYNGLPFKCDDLASSRINKIVTGITVGANPFPLTWITRNSEQGVVVFNTKEEFVDFYTTFSNYELQIQVKEATLKMQIELANTQEELDNIVFE